MPYSQNLNQNFYRITATTTGDVINFPSSTRRIQVYNRGGNVLNLFTNSADWTAGVNYFDVPATTGSFDGTLPLRSLYFKSAAATTSFVLVAYYADGITTS
jgi:hypothetical protein